MFAVIRLTDDGNNYPTEIFNVDLVTRATAGIGRTGHPRVEFELGGEDRALDGAAAVAFVSEWVRLGFITEDQKPDNWPGADYTDPEDAPWKKETDEEGRCMCPKCVARRAGGHDDGMPPNLAALFGLGKN